MKRVRKNAKKKIRALLESSVGIIADYSKMQIDDSYESTHKLVSSQDVMDWLADDFNYGDANCLLEEGLRFTVKGPYYFCDRFVAYFDNNEFQQDKKRYGLDSDVDNSKVTHTSDIVH